MYTYVGMGLETAKYLASQGAKVSIADVQEEPLKAVAAEIENAGGKVTFTVVDVRDRSKVENWIHNTVETFGKIDGCANLAGVIGKQNNMAKIQDIDDEDWDFVQAVNIKGLLNCMRAQIPRVRLRHFDQSIC
jgi:NADP-dependent 3-hydroxy acid dehydrogenase YdfG